MTVPPSPAHTHGQGHDESNADHVHGLAAMHGPSALRVVAVSSVVLAAVAAMELTAAALSQSAGVLADGLHNLGDVSTTIALGVAFTLSRRAPSRRFPYGFHRAEDLAGLLVLALIIGSAVASGVTSVEHLVHRQAPANIPLGISVALGGFAGNELAAQYKITRGRRLRSVALIADGRHSRLDGLASLGAAAGLTGAAFGMPILDPVAGIVITVVIGIIAWETARTVTGRLLDEADASLLVLIESVARDTHGVVAVSNVRARWTGRRVLAEITLELDPASTLASAHALGEQVRHELYHHVESLADVVIHLDPAGDPSAHSAVSHHLPAGRTGRPSR